MSIEDIEIKLQLDPALLNKVTESVNRFKDPALLNKVTESVNRFKVAIESLNAPSPLVLRGLSGLGLLHPYRGTLRPGMFVAHGRLVDPEDYYRQGQADALEILAAESESDSIGDLSCINNARCPQLRCAMNPLGPCEGCRDYVQAEEGL